MASHEWVSLIDSNTSLKVSSTLEKATGKKNLIDNNPETCWTSQQGLPQFIQLGFEDRVLPKRLSITFQGGFVGTRCALFVTDGKNKKDWQIFATVYPEDVNRRQAFNLMPEQYDGFKEGIVALKLVFETSSDFFGRITVYDLKIEGLII
ncbi:Nuclear receptor 2C2-associated protein [Psilocybe cubensis]|uniref:Nuclear receptor 2C2-associated protein n=2 Tax=Psilocybe cubensis TaxID=181762 RepID=A0ACB8HGZ5_PSICU|nr:Nuclear receptor 2C2-associated protein [Psilocybe cubensis]KAH9486395.1 Nuclear receptor 2C2-associated protein [Psilocybe cubensis]